MPEPPPGSDLATPVARPWRDLGLTIVGPLTQAWRGADRPAFVALTAYLLLFLWGRHGELELLRPLGWGGLGSADDPARAVIIAGLGWDQELITFVVGALLLVILPVLLLRWRYGARPVELGLGWVPREHAGFAWRATLALAVLAVPAMIVAASDPGMRAVYPFYRQFGSAPSFIAYELAYALFFVVIEFAFRGYLLFGLAESSPRTPATPGRPGLGHAAIFVSALAYTIWHHGKPMAELGGTLLWGVVTGAMILRMRSIWPVVLVHWGMNVLLDALIWSSLP
ncbi:MAG: CPBP family intramembrane metalloprotease [Deltaproteobacteria bacterium]|nr:CPBP family intramembrane metalloprotease [Deltaproteobacteria bacterium]